MPFYIYVAKPAAPVEDAENATPNAEPEEAESELYVSADTENDDGYLTVTTQEHSPQIERFNQIDGFENAGAGIAL